MERLIKKYELIIAWAIFTFGAVLRVYHLDYPLGLHGDEAWTGIEARRILLTGPIGLWSPSALGQPALPFYWTAAVFKIFGESVITLRFSFAVLSILSLPFFYFTLRMLFSKKIALLSFFLYVSSFVFINFSHVAPTHALFMLPFSITMFFFFLSLQKKKTTYYLIAGFFLGLSPYFYVGLRIFPLLFICILLVKSRKKDFIRESWLQIILFFLTAFLVFLPLGAYGLQHKEDFMTRTNMVSIFSKDALKHENTTNSYVILWKNTRKVFFMFYKSGDSDAQDNYANSPLFIYPAFFLFLVGFLSQIFSIKRDEKMLYLYLWFLLFLSGTLITVDAPNYRRIQPAIAASTIFIAFGVFWIYEFVTKRYHWLKNWVASLLGIVIVIIVLSNILLFFNKQSHDGLTKYIFSYPLVRTASYLHTLPQPFYTYFYSDRWSYHYETLRFLADTFPGEDRSNIFGSYSLSNSHSDETVVYLFLPEYETSFQTLQSSCPQGTEHIEKDTDGQTIFFAYIIPKHTCL